MKGCIRMKKIICIFISLFFAFSLASCNLAKLFNLPDKVIIHDKEYTRAFVAKLYPCNDYFSGPADTKVHGEPFYKHTTGEYECFIAYGSDGEPNIYFLTNEYEKALSYYNNGDNYNYFCVRQSSPDSKCTHPVTEIRYDMFEKLSEFSTANCYHPFSSNNEDGLQHIIVSGDDYLKLREVHFYRESKDGSFSENRGHTLINTDGKLTLLYRYEFSDDGTSCKIRMRDLPPELNDYFYNLLYNLPNE